MAEVVDDGVGEEGLVAGGDEVDGAVAFGQGEGFEGGGNGDALGEGGGFCLFRGGVRRGSLLRLLGEGGGKAEEAEKAGDLMGGGHLAIFAWNAEDVELV